MYVAGIDPGTHTGVAVWEVGEVVDPVLDSEQWLASGDSFEDHYKMCVDICGWMRGQVKGGERVYVGLEDFYLRGPGSTKSSDRSGISPLLVGGMLYTLLRRHGADWKVAMQQPSEVSALTNPRLKARGLWVPDDKTHRSGADQEHRRDAWRHVVLRASKLKKELRAEWAMPGKTS